MPRNGSALQESRWKNKFGCELNHLFIYIIKYSIINIFCNN
jgi:hypothetical protein